MSWGARIEHTAGGLATTFAELLTRVDMSADVAAHFASLIAIEARHHVAGVARALEAESTSPAPLARHVLCCDCSACLNGDRDG